MAATDVCRDCGNAEAEHRTVAGTLRCPMQTHREKPTLAPPSYYEMALELDEIADKNVDMSRQLQERANELRSVARRLRGGK
jgi:hypothetical protein